MDQTIKTSLSVDGRTRELSLDPRTTLLDLLREHPDLSTDLGERGRRYVNARYRWDTVLAKVEHLCETAVHLHRQVVPASAMAPFARSG